nr:hypothetical protein [Butyricicoccus sp. AF22-28AC]
MIYRLDLDKGKMYKLVKASWKGLTGSDFHGGKNVNLSGVVIITF